MGFAYSLHTISAATLLSLCIPILVPWSAAFIPRTVLPDRHYQRPLSSLGLLCLVEPRAFRFVMTCAPTRTGCDTNASTTRPAPTTTSMPRCYCLPPASTHHPRSRSHVGGVLVVTYYARAAHWYLLCSPTIVKHAFAASWTYSAAHGLQPALPPRHLGLTPFSLPVAWRSSARSADRNLVLRAAEDISLSVDAQHALMLARGDASGFMAGAENKLRLRLPLGGTPPPANAYLLPWLGYAPTTLLP